MQLMLAFLLADYPAKKQHRQQQGEQAVTILWTLCRHLTIITDARPSIINKTLLVDHHDNAKPEPNQH